MNITLENIAKQTLQKWINTLKTLDSNKMVSLYHYDAVLLPTLDSVIRDTPEKIKEYFNSFLAKEPNCSIHEMKEINLSDRAVSVVGHYGFSFKDGSMVDARFTYIFTKTLSSDKWAISHHHSSLQP